MPHKPTNLVHTVDTFASLAFLFVRSPRAVGNVLRLMGSTVRDVQFERASPLPVVPSWLATAIGQYAVLLPARTLLQPGNQALDGLLHLVGLAKAIEARTIFEIGTYNGVTALTLAMNLPQATIHTLDLPPGQMPSLPLFEQDYDNLSGFRERVYAGYAEASRITQHLGDSAEFDFSPFYAGCQLVYVDGAHSLEYVKNDTQAAFAMVSDPGIVVWDDYWRRVPDVPGYLHQLRKPNLYRLPNSRLVVWFSDGALAMLRHRMKANVGDMVHGRRTR